VNLVVQKYDGALKAEHGTGRNMAPFVETEWGPEAYAVMQRLKELADPDNLLNPGVIINPDPQAHMADLKRMPVVEPEVDKCIECGYCEPKCPSRDLTLTPRQRIVVRREMQRLKDSGTHAAYDALNHDFPYMALDTCAVDGLCATACPVSIDTGKLTKRFRQSRHTEIANRIALLLANNMGLMEVGARFAMGAGHLTQKVFGLGFMRGITGILNKKLSGSGAQRCRGHGGVRFRCGQLQMRTPFIFLRASRALWVPFLASSKRPQLCRLC
jgi:D-lactate dehydrogenase